MKCVWRFGEAIWRVLGGCVENFWRLSRRCREVV